MAKSFGHEITRLAPSLVPIEVAEDLRQIAGVRAKAKVSLWRLGRLIAEEMGELQLNKDCLSGICIMNLSRLLVLTEGKPISEAFCEYEIRVDLFPEMTLEQLNTLLSDRVHLTESLLRSMVKEKLAAYLLNQTKHMSEKERIPFLCRLIKDLRFHVTGTKGWNDAQVTRGGVSLSEIDEDTMESKLQKGLYFAGEITDYDGPCGGFNLHYAWLSGSKAGKAMAAALATEAEGADHRISCGDHNYV